MPGGHEAGGGASVFGHLIDDATGIERSTEGLADQTAL